MSDHLQELINVLIHVCIFAYLQNYVLYFCDVRISNKNEVIYFQWHSNVFLLSNFGINQFYHYAQLKLFKQTLIDRVA